MTHYNGLEIDMLSLGNADSILVTKWEWGTPTRVLIDGGNANSYDTVRNFLADQGVSFIHHMVCTHPHDDHAAGLVKLVRDPTLEFGAAWMHLPYFHLDLNKIVRTRQAGESYADHLRHLKETVDAADRLHSALIARHIPVFEPFAGMNIEFLKVCGPTREFYMSIIDQLSNTAVMYSYNEQRSQLDIRDSLEEAISVGESGLLASPITSPENESSVILVTEVEGNKYLLTGDAGIRALGQVASGHELASCYWMQAPHHGSRRNITKQLIDYFCPQVVFVSAEGTLKHPRRAVVNAFKDIGTKVFSTHYPTSANLQQRHGNVPPRSHYGPAVELYEAS